MKLSHIIILLIIAVSIGVIISTTGDASQYVDFAKAEEMAKDGDDDQVHIVGKLAKDADGVIKGMIYDPMTDPNKFQFTMIDNQNIERTVIYKNAKPQDFDKSEQVVVVGTMQGDIFVAEQILMKCPSKYEETEVKGA